MNIFKKIKVINKVLKIVDIIKTKGLQEKFVSIIAQIKDLAPEIKTAVNEIIEICK